MPQERTQQLEEELQRTQEEVKRLRTAAATSPSPVASTSADSLRGKVLSTVDRELANLKPRGSRDDSLSVKNLIHSIEKQVKNTFKLFIGLFFF